MFYTAAWCLNEEKFKSDVPFESLGRSIRKFNSTISFNIVFLHGIELLSESYLTSLKNWGFNVIDYSKGFDQIVNRYSSIDKFYSIYERNCFLRWVVFDEIVRMERPRQFWHLDSDVVLYTSLDGLAKDTEGKTFMLQGCPVFLSISNYLWFENYACELNKLNDNIIKYSDQAYREKDRCKMNDELLANSSLYRNPLGSDQDFLEYLISSGKILQERALYIYDSSYYYVQNLLSLEDHHHHQHVSSTTFEEHEDGTITVDLKKVAFIHYQNTFVEYATVYIFLRKLRMPSFLIRAILDYRIDDTAFRVNFLYRVVRKVGKMTYGINRQNIINLLMKERQRGTWLKDVLNLVSK